MKNNNEILSVYKDKLHSDAGKKYHYSSVEDRHRTMLVCHSCYVFYRSLQKRLFDENGQIRHKEVHKISDPQYEVDHAKR